MIDWTKFPSFRAEEFKCSHTGLNKMDADFLTKLQTLRFECGFPFIISSGYRHSTHPVEAAKNSPGEHTQGKAADIKIDGERAYKLLQLAPKHGFVRIGIKQHGSGRYIHLGTSKDFPWPRIWTY